MKTLFPDYNRCQVNIANSILKYYGAKTSHSSLKELDKYLNKDYKNVVLILYDGFGSKLIENNLGKDSFLCKNKVDDLTAVFPATTTAATTSIISGLTPIEHCWLGWNIYVKSLDKTVTMFKNVLKDTDTPAADYNVTKREFPYATIFDQINATDHCQAHYLSPFDGTHYDTNNLDDMYDKIANICGNGEKNFVYAYCAEPDATMHGYGTRSDQSIDMMRFLDDKTKELCDRLGDDTLIIITADHGHMDIKKHFVLTDYPKLKNMLARETSLETRAVNFFVKEGMIKAFQQEFKKQFSEDDFILSTKREVIDRRLFGDGTPNAKFDSCLGDFLVIAVSDASIVDDYNAPSLGLKSHHAGLTENEVLIPLIIIDKKSQT